MRKAIAMMTLLTFLVYLAACGVDTPPKGEQMTATNTPSPITATDATKPQDTEDKPSDTSFKAELLIDLKSLEDQFTENELPALEILENNLTALVQHDQKLYQSGFANEELAEAMKFYYDEQLLYKFTDIEYIEKNVNNRDAIHIIVLGERQDATTGTVEEIKMFYSIIRKKDQEDWFIDMID